MKESHGRRKKRDPLGAAKDILSDPGTASSLLSAALGEEIQVVEVIEDTSFLHQPIYPDLVIHHEGEDFVFGFFCRGDSADMAGEMLLMQFGTAIGLHYSRSLPKSLAVWVGDSLVADSELVIDNQNQTYRCAVVDIREEFGANSRLTPIQREVLKNLKAVHQAHGGLFQRLLELSPEEHQGEFVKIAESFGYEAVGLRVIP
jgi:hypothetical protein